MVSPFPTPGTSKRFSTWASSYILRLLVDWRKFYKWIITLQVITSHQKPPITYQSPISGQKLLLHIKGSPPTYQNHLPPLQIRSRLLHIRVPPFTLESSVHLCYLTIFTSIVRGWSRSGYRARGRADPPLDAGVALDATTLRAGTWGGQEWQLSWEQWSKGAKKWMQASTLVLRHVLIVG